MMENTFKEEAKVKTIQIIAETFNGKEIMYTLDLIKDKFQLLETIKAIKIGLIDLEDYHLTLAEELMKTSGYYGKDT